MTRNSAKHLAVSDFLCTFAAEKNQKGMSEKTKNNGSVSSEAKSPWLDKLGDYLLDVSKYVLTGVVITSLFNNIKEQMLIYSLGIMISLCSLFVGLVLTNKKKGK